MPFFYSGRQAETNTRLFAEALSDDRRSEIRRIQPEDIALWRRFFAARRTK